jgi:preprotein translocase subunit SecE
MIKFMRMKPVIAYVSEVKLELSKVVWPTREEVIKLTIIVLAISGAVALYVGALDFLLTKILTVVLTS